MPASDNIKPAAAHISDHPWFVRFTHWTSAVSVFVLAFSGLQIFYAFPSFGPKIPQHDIVRSIPRMLRLGGWLGGALRWHFTFMWVFAGSGLLYVTAQAIGGHYRTVLFGRKDVSGVWPMVRHYFFFGEKPPQNKPYNPLQKLAYTTAVFLGAILLLTGAVMYKPVQLSALGALFGGYHAARVVHFVAMCALLAFVPGHLIMVALHGWDNFVSIVIGWKPQMETASPRSRGLLTKKEIQ